ncbi:MAG TPA: hypothetical protein VHR35_10100 [Nocardioides sp.]|jgi:uncharacterized protein with PQ loop repeat|nr:hypothetical protein [Nocardioides sp.]
MWSSVATVAGTLATLVFALSTLPMLGKAFRSRDLTSYSMGNLVLGNVGNAIYSIYVFQLPLGPIWFLHGFYLLSSGLMLFWSRRFRGARCVNLPTPSDGMDRSPDAVDRPGFLV